MIKSFNGKAPRIAPSAFISETAYISGDVEVGESSGVWPGAVVRSDIAAIKVGHHTNIEDNAVVHAGAPLEIGDNVIIGHGAVIHGTKIGNYTLIGNNATVLNWVEIGDYCIIAAGCVVPEKMTVPDRSFVAGVPGRIKGEVSAERVEWLRKGVEIYSALVRQYKEQGL